MSALQGNAVGFRRELEMKDELMLVASVEDLLRAWKRKNGIDLAPKACMPCHASSRMPSAPQTAPIPMINRCHSLAEPMVATNTDAVPFITKKNIGETIEFVDGFFTKATTPFKDVMMHVVPIAKDLGFKGLVVLKKVNGKEYVIIKGYAGNRSFLTGTRYLGTHPKIMQLAVGKVALKKTIQAGGRLTVYLTIGFELLKLVLGKKELSECGVTIASDLVKIGIATAISEAISLAAVGTASVGAFAAGPIIVAIAVGIGVTLGLDYLDNRFQLTDRVVAAIDKMGEQVIKELRSDYYNACENIYQGIRHWIYRESGGFDIENPTAKNMF